MASCGFVLAWGFAWIVGLCVRERLGGLEACCVFALVFPLFALVFVLVFFFFAFVVLGLSSCLPCLFLCPCGVCVFFFPYGWSGKKKGRKGFAPCVLSSFIVGLLYPHKFV